MDRDDRASSSRSLAGPPPRSRLVVGLLVALAGLALATLLALVQLWPGGREVPGFDGRLDTTRGEVVAVDAAGCRATPAPVTGGVDAPSCRRVTVRLEEGPERGRETSFDLGGGVSVDVGDGVRVSDSGAPEGAQIGGVPVDRFSFSDFERGSSLLWLTLAFAALVVVATRWRGVRALVGLAVSLGLIVLFVVPAILEGSPPLVVATAGAFAIMLVTIPLAHGGGPLAIAACLGTAVALLLTVMGAELATDLAHITGFASEEATVLQAGGSQLSVQGLLLAGIVIGALGVLDDLTVTQASTVLALRRANPSLGAGELYRRGVAVGHDHIVATVNTLVLAYAGAALPVLLVFSVAGTDFLDAINSEVIASEIVATLVGSMALVLAVPITTALAALLAARLAPDEVGGVHAHHH